MNKERFQSFCAYCTRVFEADTAIQAIRATEEHEKTCPRKPKEVPCSKP